jgi:uncharacterized protein (TIGR02246 family)
MYTCEGMNDLAARYTEAWCSGQPERVASFFAPNGSLKVNDGDPAVGREAITELARGFMTAFPNLLLVCDRVVEGGERIEYHWTLSGAYAETGAHVHISGVERWILSPEGLIADSLGSFDESDYARQLGRRLPE